MNTGHEVTINGVTLAGPAVPRQNELFTAEALGFLAQLHREFAPRIAALGTAGQPHRGAPAAAADWQKLVERNLAEPPSTFVYPRRLAQAEDRIRCGSEPMSAGIVDFGLHIHRNAHRLLSQGRAPFMSLLGTETEEELQLWQDLFIRAEELLGLTDGAIRAIHMQPGVAVEDEGEDGQASSAAVLMVRTQPTPVVPAQPMAGVGVAA